MTTTVSNSEFCFITAWCYYCANTDTFKKSKMVLLPSLSPNTIRVKFSLVEHLVLLLVDSIDGGMVTGHQNCVDNGLLGNVCMAQVHKRVQLPEGVIVASHVEAVLMVRIHSGVVAVKPLQFNVVVQHVVDRVHIISPQYSGYYALSLLFHELSVLHKGLDLSPSSLLFFWVTGELDNVLLDSNRDLRSSYSSFATGEPLRGNRGSCRFRCLLTLEAAYHHRG